MIRDGFLRYHEDLEPLLQPIDSVTPDPRNYNNGDVEALTESIRENGMYRPVYVQRETGNIIAGNHTWMACKELGATRIPVVYLEGGDTEAAKIMLADNRIASFARPDNGLLLALLEEIATNDTLSGTGYNTDDLEVIKHLNEIPLDTDEDSFAQWPTLTVQVPPHVLRGYMHMTREADTDRDRFELLLRLAGWDG
jgi:hypothetical protein